MIPFFVLFLLHNRDFHPRQTDRQQKLLSLSLFQGCGTPPKRMTMCDDASDSWVFVRYLPAFSSIDFSDEKVWIVDATTVASAIAVRSTFLFNPNLHALHNWKGTSTLERILMSSSLKVESRLPHEFNLANAPFSKLDTWSSESTISWSEEDNAKKVVKIYFCPTAHSVWKSH